MICKIARKAKEFREIIRDAYLFFYLRIFSYLMPNFG